MSARKTYTLAEIIPLLCPENDEQEAYRISRKLQNQATVGIIHPITSQHSGRGVRRRYDKYELYKARVLLEMEPYHAPNSVLRLVADLFDDSNPDRSSPLSRDSTSRKKAKKRLSQYMSAAIDGKQSIYLIINVNGARGLQAFFSKENKIDSTWRSAIMLNLTEIIRTVK